MPNNFDKRLDTKNHKQIRKALAPIQEHVLQLLFSLSPPTEIEDENQPYRLVVVILVKSASLRDQEVLSLIEEAKDKIEDILQGRPGIDANVALAGDETMPYANFRTFSRWGFEDLSLESTDT